MNLSEINVGARVQAGIVPALPHGQTTSAQRTIIPPSTPYAYCRGYYGTLENLGVKGEAIVKALTVFSNPLQSPPIYLRILKIVNSRWVIAAQSESALVLTGNPTTFNMVSVQGVTPPKSTEDIAIVAVYDPNSPAHTTEEIYLLQTTAVAGTLAEILYEFHTKVNVWNDMAPAIKIEYTQCTNDDLRQDPVFWRVISNDIERFGGVLLLQEKIHTSRAFDSEGKNDWVSSELREWANATWKHYFSTFFQKQIKPQNGDSFFLLSQDELDLLPDDIFQKSPEDSAVYSQTVAESRAQSISGFSLRDAISQCVAAVDYSAGTPRIIAVPAPYQYQRPRLACVLNSAMFVRWVTDENGSYYKIAHKPVAVQPVIPDNVYRNTAFILTWNYSLLESELKEFVLERRDDGGEWFEVYRGTATELAQTSGGGRTIQYRLKVEDAEGEVSDWTESQVHNLNKAPTITAIGVSDSAGNVQGVGAGIAYPRLDIENKFVKFTITDDIVNDVKVRFTVVGLLGLAVKRVLGEQTVSCSPNVVNEITCEIPAIELRNGNYYVVAEVTDSDGGYSLARLYFEKYTSGLSFKSIPIGGGVDLKPVAARFSLDSNINDYLAVEGFVFSFEACNNALDASPRWEDATESVINATNFIFANTTKTAAKWQVAVRITARSYTQLEEPFYINSISGSTATA